MSTAHADRCTAHYVVDQVAADVAQMLLLVPEGARQEALLGLLEGFCDQCRESGVIVSEQDQMLFVDTVIAQLEAKSATIAVGNDKQRAS